MLVLSRKSGESIQVGPNIRVVVVSTANGRVKLGIDAPDHVRILRSELIDYDGEDARSDAPVNVPADTAALVASH